MTLPLGDAAATLRTVDKALDRGVFAQPLLPPAVAAGQAGLRLAVMASHSKSELRDAARALAQAAKAAGADPATARPARLPAHPEPFDADEHELPIPAPAAGKRRAELWDDGGGWVEQRRPRPRDRPPGREGARDLRRRGVGRGRRARRLTQSAALTHERPAVPSVRSSWGSWTERVRPCGLAHPVLPIHSSGHV